MRGPTSPPARAALAAYADEAHYVHVYVSQIRRKVAAADPAGELARLIVAEPGVGYRVRLPEPDGS